MPRKLTNPTNPSQQVIEAIDTPLNLEFDQVCERLSIAEPELRDRLENYLKDPHAQRWSTIPAEHSSLIEALARDLEAEASVRRFDAPQRNRLPNFHPCRQFKKSRSCRRNSSLVTTSISQQL